jgi:hypothetical protein
MLAIMLPNLVPVQTLPAPVQTPARVQALAVAKPQRTRVQAPVSDPAPVVVNETPVVNATLVAAVAQAPAGVQELVGQVQNVVPEISTAMEVEDEDAMLERLFFKKYGRALPEREKEKDNEVDQINFVIDLTDDTDEMESDPTPVLIPVVKTEPIEIANVSEVNVTNESGVEVAKRRSFRLERLEMAKARKEITAFGQSLRKKEVIPEKEPENVIATEDTDMPEDTSVESVNAVESVKAVESVNPESGNNMTYEQTMAAIDAAIADN